MSLEDRFWAKVDQRGPDECWPWLGGCNSHGYGVIRSHSIDGPLLLAHRVSLELAGIELGPSTRHTCDNPPCVNPAHLIPGTQAENTGDMIARGRGLIGTLNGHAKLDPGKVLAIRAAALTGATYAEIGEEFGVNASAIGKIVRRERWQHVPA